MKEQKRISINVYLTDEQLQEISELKSFDSFFNDIKHISKNIYVTTEDAEETNKLGKIFSKYYDKED